MFKKFRKKGNLRLSDRKEKKQKIKKIFKTALSLSACIVTFLLFVSFISYVYGFILKAPFFELQDIWVSSTTKVTAEDILKIAQIMPKANILSLDLRSIEKKVLTNPWVKSVEIFRRLPHKIKIQLQEKDILALRNVAGNLYYIEPDGSIIAGVASKEGLNFTVITSSCTGEEESVFFDQALALLKSVKENQYFKSDKISEIHLQSSQGLVAYYLPYGTRIKLGSQNLKTKVERLEKVLADLSQKNIAAREIDLNFSKKVVVKILKKP